MEGMMIRLLNMTITASFAAVFVIVLRLLFKRLPKRFTFVLWLVVVFRFLCPVSFSSPYSLLPVYSEPVNQAIVYEEIPSIESGVFFVDRPVNQVLEQTMAATELSSINPIQIVLWVMAIVWEAGMLIFFLYHFFSYIRLKRKLGTAVKMAYENASDSRGAEYTVYESERIPGAFILGIFRPVIYLPANLTKEERECILRHERIHVKRRDYIVQLLGFLMVMVHWFNPFAYISYRLLCEDMEMSCDEAVVSELGEGGRKQYSLTLLAAAEKVKGVRYPLAFGGSWTKSRIENVLRYKKSGLVTIAVAVVITGAAAVGLLTARERPVRAESVAVIGGQDGPTSIFVAAKGDEEEIAKMTEMPETTWLSSQVLEKGTENTVSIVFASKEKVIFHGTCGLFSFMLKDGTWVPEMIIGPDSSGSVDGEQIDSVVDGVRDRLETIKSVGRSDAFVSQQSSAGNSFLDYDAVKLEDGSVAVLGGMGTGSSNGEFTGRLVDVFYDWYHPDDMVMHQVYLFSGDGKMTEEGEGLVRERRYLFSTDGADYFLRTPETALDFEYIDGETPENFHFPYGRQELIRIEGDTTEVLDPLVTEHEKFILAEGRIIYYGAAEADMVSFKSPSLVGIRTDGSDRRVAELAYNVCRGLCYDNGYLYFEGWTNDHKFPRPIYRMKTDFSEIVKLGDFNGSLISAADGTLYMLSAEKPAIVLTRPEDLKEVRYYDKCGYDAVNYACATAAVSDGKLRIQFVHTAGDRELTEYEIPLAETGWWE